MSLALNNLALHYQPSTTHRQVIQNLSLAHLHKSIGSAVAVNSASMSDSTRRCSDIKIKSIKIALGNKEFIKEWKKSHKQKKNGESWWDGSWWVISVWSRLFESDYIWFEGIILRVNTGNILFISFSLSYVYCLRLFDYLLCLLIACIYILFFITCLLSLFILFVYWLLAYLYLLCLNDFYLFTLHTCICFQSFLSFLPLEFYLFICIIFIFELQEMKRGLQCNTNSKHRHSVHYAYAYGKIFGIGNA